MTHVDLISAPFFKNKKNYYLAYLIFTILMTISLILTFKYLNESNCDIDLDAVRFVLIFFSFFISLLFSRFICLTYKVDTNKPLLDNNYYNA